MPDEPRWEPLNDRVGRFFKTTDLEALRKSRRAIIGPRADLMTAEAAEARKLLLDDDKTDPTPRQRAAFEQVVRMQRPAPLIQDDGVVHHAEAIEEVFPAWSDFCESLKTLHWSIGRIEMFVAPKEEATGETKTVGTGFLAAPDLLVTALHVVDLISYSTRVLQRGQAVVDFHALWNIAGQRRSHVLSIAAMDPKTDLAVLRIEPNHDTGVVVPTLAASDIVFEFGTAVAVVGFPSAPDEELIPGISKMTFGNRLEVKRCSPGDLIGNSDQGFFHDASTLRGNSGSPVLNMATSQVCGVHVSGRCLMRNAAAGVKPLRNLLDSLSGDSASPILSRKITTAGIQMADAKSNFESFMRRLQEFDPDIAKELAKAKDAKATAESTDRTHGLQPETIVLTQGRPVLDIKQGETIIEFADVESEIWRTRLTDSVPLLASGIPAVGRIELSNHPRGVQWLGSGWLIHEDIVVTNRHVADKFAEHADNGTFRFLPGFDGTPMKSQVDFLEEFGVDHSHEFPVFEVVHMEKKSGPDIAFLRIKPTGGQEMPTPVAVEQGTIDAGQQVAVIGYPARDDFFPYPAIMDRIFNSRYDKKRLAPGLITESTSQRLLHDCSTLGGNSGGKVVSLATGKAVGLHFAGTLFQANHAVPMPVVLESLHEAIGRRPRPDNGCGSVRETTESSRTIEATIPIRVRVELGDVQSASIVSADTPPPTSPPAKPLSDVDFGDNDEILETEARVEDYADRDGYNEAFLGEGFEVPLPELTANQSDIVTFELDGETHSVLKYRHFSVVMSRSRRLCRFSACNIDGKTSKRRRRKGWRTDPRIPKELQIIKECYGNAPKFSRGHMARREDPIWGSDADADQGNTDSMHVTNAAPQMQSFNGGIWLRLEDYALDNAREDDMRISVFTGPFLGRTDPFRYGVKIPITFWKVIAFIHDETGELSATGYTMTQHSFLQDEEFVFGQHETHQRPIAEIEQRAGITFGGLADVDPKREVVETSPTMLTSPDQILWK